MQHAFTQILLKPAHMQVVSLGGQQSTSLAISSAVRPSKLNKNKPSSCVLPGRSQQIRPVQMKSRGGQIQRFEMCGKFKITCTETFNLLASNKINEPNFEFTARFEIFGLDHPLISFAPALNVCASAHSFPHFS